MSDVATAATMNALNVERLQLRASVEALQALLEERRAYAERLLSENVRLTNEAAEVRQELEQYRMRLVGALIASEGGDGQPSDALEYLRTCPTITSVMKLRQALDRERERCGVLEREVRAYREWQRTKCDDNASSLDHWHACKALDAATLETDTRHALDAAKFVGGG